MVQYGFYFDQSRCTGCNTCVIACKQWNGIPPGPVKGMRVYQWEKGAFPKIRIHLLAISCYHCENPVCVRACPNGALIKEEKYGAVLVDTGAGGAESAGSPVPTEHPSTRMTTRGPRCPSAPCALTGWRRA